MSSDIPTSVWLVSIAGFCVLVAFDLLVVARRPTANTRSNVLWLVYYLGLACLFGVGLVLLGPDGTGGEFFAGYVTEYSLSVDNLFVFLVIMNRMRVPLVAQDRVLIIAILLSLVLRVVLILVGLAAISAASWTFYLLGAFLLYTAIKLATDADDDEKDFREGRTVKLLRRWTPMTDRYEGERFVVRLDGRRQMTPLVLAICSLGIANVVFAVDSIPAIFGLTTNSYVVLAANAFALMGLRQLYFVVEKLLTRLQFLKYGLVVILGFIGVKLILEAMWDTHLRHLGSWSIPQVSTSTSLLVIVGVLAVVTVTSVLADRLSGATKQSD